MLFSDFVRGAQTRIAKRRAYTRLVDEINGLTERDLADFGGDRSEMLYRAYQKVYG